MLRSFGLESFAKDKNLVTALTNPSLRSYSKSEVIELIDSLQLQIVSTIPTALMNPYGPFHPPSHHSPPHLQTYSLSSRSKDITPTECLKRISFTLSSLPFALLSMLATEMLSLVDLISQISTFLIHKQHFSSIAEETSRGYYSLQLRILPKLACLYLSLRPSPLNRTLVILSI